MVKKASALGSKDATVDSAVSFLEALLDRTEEGLREQVRASGRDVPNIDAVIAQGRRLMLEKTIEMAERMNRLPPGYCSIAPTPRA
jgi:hypothetical protein